MVDESLKKKGNRVNLSKTMIVYKVFNMREEEKSVRRGCRYLMLSNHNKSFIVFLLLCLALFLSLYHYILFFTAISRIFFSSFSSKRRHTRSLCDWSSDVCSSDLKHKTAYV